MTRRSKTLDRTAETVQSIRNSLVYTNFACSCSPYAQ